MENNTTNLIEWTAEDVKKEIEKTFNKDIGKKFEGKIKIMSLRLAKVQTRSLETSLGFPWKGQLSLLIEVKHFFSFIDYFGVLAA